MSNWLAEEAKRCKKKTSHWPQWRKELIKQTPAEYSTRSKL